MSNIKNEMLFRPPELAEKYAPLIADKIEKPNILEGREKMEANEVQLKLLADLNQAVGEFFIDIDLPVEKVSAENMHIIDPKKFGRLKKRADLDEINDSVYYGGKIYIKNGEQENFFYNLSHAMAHAQSGTRRKILIEPEPGTSFIHVSQFDIKSGYELDNEEEKSLGKGFNEAITEILAGYVRDYYNRSKELNRDDLDFNNYLPQIYVVMELAEMINPNDSKEALFELIRGYTGNEADIWKLLSKTFRDYGVENGLKILLKMDLSIDSAMDTAKKLQLNKAVAKIRAIQKIKN